VTIQSSILETPKAPRERAIQICQDILATPDDWAILDTETTSFGGEPVEIGILGVDGDTFIDQRILPTTDISAGALEVHGITRESLIKSNAPTWPEVRDEVIESLLGRSLLIYNAPFDLRIIHNAEKAYGIKPHSIFNRLNALCIMRLYSKFLGVKRWQKLKGDHSAIGDCRAVLSLIKAMANAQS